MKSLSENKLEKSYFCAKSHQYTKRHVQEQESTLWQSFLYLYYHHHQCCWQTAQHLPLGTESCKQHCSMGERMFNQQMIVHFVHTSTRETLVIACTILPKDYIIFSILKYIVVCTQCYTKLLLYQLCDSEFFFINSSI